MAGACAAWTTVAAMIVIVASGRVARGPAPRPSRPRAGPTVVALVLELGETDAFPVLWLKLTVEGDDRLMRVRATDHDVTVETDLTKPPSLRRFDLSTPVGSLASRVLWIAASEGPETVSAHARANQLLALLAVDECGARVVGGA